MTPAQIEKTTTSETIRWAHSALDLNYSEIGAVLHADERTIRRWRDRQFAPHGRHRERIESFREFRYLLDTVFETKRDADEWLHSSLPALRGRTPISLVRRGEVERVIEILATIESGAYL